jgi:hypothetical protein
MTSLSQDIQYPGQDLNQPPPEYKSEALLFEPTCLVIEKVDSNSEHTTLMNRWTDQGWQHFSLSGAKIIPKATCQYELVPSLILQ